MLKTSDFKFQVEAAGQGNTDNLLCWRVEVPLRISELREISSGEESAY